MILYCDSSYFLSLLFQDEEYESALAVWNAYPMKFSSDLLRFESLMAIRRKFSESPDAELLAARLATMRQLISEINLLRIDENIYDLLGENVKISHKTLDAIHLATMFYIRQTREAEPILAGVYDKKFRSLCEMHEIKVI